MCMHAQHWVIVRHTSASFAAMTWLSAAVTSNASRASDSCFCVDRSESCGSRGQRNFPGLFACAVTNALDVVWSSTRDAGSAHLQGGVLLLELRAPVL